MTQIEKSHKSKSYYNYFIGDQNKWASNVHGYGEATLKEFYSGIDLKLIEKQEQLKYEFHVRPKMDPGQIRMNYRGKIQTSLDEAGNLIIKTPLGEIMEEAPYAYQIVNGNIREVECAFKLVDGLVTFDIGDYADYATLIIDPVLVFATYAGSVTDLSLIHI